MVHDAVRHHGAQHFRSGVLAVSASVFAAALFCDAQSASAQFIQQGPKLVGVSPVANQEEGFQVALSADGNTAIVSGPSENGDHNGAAWVFTRSGWAWTQQAELVGTPTGVPAEQGASVALSADGNTAIVGGPCDASSSAVQCNLGIGAAWVFTRNGGVWTQQAKLVGTGVVGGASFQGYSVALSADGNTAIVSGPNDNSQVGAAWVFTRSGAAWTQQAKLVANDTVGQALFGTGAALSADGNTAIFGGFADNSFTGAAWVFTRTGGVWAQQGPKLVGTGAVGFASQGNSVAVSADGNTAIEGGVGDNGVSRVGVGAAWVFTRSGGVWAQQGPKLVGTSAVGTSQQGSGVALSADGNIAIVGGDCDNPGANCHTDVTPGVGAAWVFTRSLGAWSQQGPKLVGTGATGNASQGFSVALSADGGTAIVGGRSDNTNIGAAWVFINPTKDDCKDGGWLNFVSPTFTNQGQCVSYFAH